MRQFIYFLIQFIAFSLICYQSAFADNRRLVLKRPLTISEIENPSLVFGFTDAYEYLSDFTKNIDGLEFCPPIGMVSIPIKETNLRQVMRVKSGCSADLAGIKDGDIIVSSTSLFNLAHAPAGEHDVVTLSVMSPHKMESHKDISALIHRDNYYRTINILISEAQTVPTPPDADPFLNYHNFYADEMVTKILTNCFLDPSQTEFDKVTFRYVIKMDKSGRLALPPQRISPVIGNEHNARVLADIQIQRAIKKCSGYLDALDPKNYDKWKSMIIEFPIYINDTITHQTPRLLIEKMRREREEERFRNYYKMFFEDTLRDNEKLKFNFDTTELKLPISDELEDLLNTISSINYTVSEGAFFLISDKDGWTLACDMSRSDTKKHTYYCGQSVVEYYGYSDIRPVFKKFANKTFDPDSLSNVNFDISFSPEDRYHLNILEGTLHLGNELEGIGGIPFKLEALPRQ